MAIKNCVSCYNTFDSKDVHKIMVKENNNSKVIFLCSGCLEIVQLQKIDNPIGYVYQLLNAHNESHYVQLDTP